MWNRVYKLVSYYSSYYRRLAYLVQLVQFLAGSRINVRQHKLNWHGRQLSVGSVNFLNYQYGSLELPTGTAMLTFISVQARNLIDECCNRNQYDGRYRWLKCERLSGTKRQSFDQRCINGAQTSLTTTIFVCFAKSFAWESKNTMLLFQIQSASRIPFFLFCGHHGFSLLFL